MAGSAHAYVRRNALKFYGPLADTDGHIDIEIRDLDHMVIGNPAHDLIRLGLSLATAARGSDHFGYGGSGIGLVLLIVLLVLLFR